MVSRELVIKIPNNYDLSKIQNGSIASKTILNAVANGTPLNEVFDKIKDEIEEIATYDGIYIDRAYVLEIIDKYRAESEDEECR